MKGRWALGIASLGLVLAVGAISMREASPAYARYAGQTRPVRLVPTLTGEPEYCLTCHQGIEEISPAHPVEVFGCVRCHGGNRLSLDVDAAHEGLLGGGNPSDFGVVEQACGGTDCHSGSAEENRDHIGRSMTSIQSTYAGAIAAVRYAFGAQPDPTARYGVNSVDDSMITADTGVASIAAFASIVEEDPPAVQKFEMACLTCHLGSEARPGAGFQRLTGCAACHSPSNLGGTYVGDDPTVSQDVSGHASIHRLTTAIPYTQCDACHNRGNHDLVTMTFHERTDLPTDQRASRIEDYYQPIAQFTKCEWELDCIDCHTSGEVMGDGDLHSSKSEVQYIQCATCHGTLEAGPQTMTITDPDDIALQRAHLNPIVDLNVGDTVVVTPRGEALWNVIQQADGTFVMVGKVTQMRYDVPLVKDSGCEQDPDEQQSSACHACHAVERP
jgi:hypothetical protein